MSEHSPEATAAYPDREPWTEATADPYRQKRRVLGDAIGRAMRNCGITVRWALSGPSELYDVADLVMQSTPYVEALRTAFDRGRANLVTSLRQAQTERDEALAVRDEAVALADRAADAGMEAVRIHEVRDEREIKAEALDEFWAENAIALTDEQTRLFAARAAAIRAGRS